MRPGWDGKTIVPGVNDPARGGDRLEIQKVTPAFGAQLRAAQAKGGNEVEVPTEDGGVKKIRVPLSPDAAKPFVGQIAGESRRVPIAKQRYQGMDPVQVRERQERVERFNAAKKRKQGKEPVAREAVIGKIREMQEGNVMMDP